MWVAKSAIREVACFLLPVFPYLKANWKPLYVPFIHLNFSKALVVGFRL